MSLRLVAVAPMTTILLVKKLLGELLAGLGAAVGAPVRLGEGDVGDRAGGADVVDEPVVRKRRDALVRRDFGGHDRERLEVRDLVLHLADHAARVKWERSLGRAGADRLQQRGALPGTDERDVARRGRLGVGEDGLAVGVVDRAQQRDVVVLPEAARLGELDVDRDRRRMLRGDRADRLAVDLARERELLVEVLERPRVDRDDHQVLGHRLRAANREAGVDRTSLERLQEARSIAQNAERRRADGDEREQQNAQISIAPDAQTPRSFHTTITLAL